MTMRYLPSATAAETRPRWLSSGPGGIFLLAAVVLASLGLGGRAAAHQGHTCRRIAIVVHEDNPAESITLNELGEIYSGRQARWESGLSIVVVAAPDESDLKEAFKKRVLSDRAGSRTVRGSPVPFRPLKLPESRAAPYVRLFPSAIAYVWEDSVVVGVRQLSVKGLDRANDEACAAALP